MILPMSIKVDGENGTGLQSKADRGTKTPPTPCLNPVWDPEETGPVASKSPARPFGARWEKWGDMKLLSDTVTASRTGRKPGFGVFPDSLGQSLSRSARRVISTIQLQSPLAADRKRSSVSARADAPASGPGGILEKPISHLEEANREWFVWRFGEDA